MRPIYSCWLVALLPSLLLTGCGSASPQSTMATRPVLALSCLQVSGTHPTTVSVRAPADGVLGFQIQELGISIAATLDADAATTAETPVERLGSIFMVAPGKRGAAHTITLRAVDAPDIAGEACVRADLLVRSDYQRAHAAYASAGRATHRHDWNGAFEDYLNAARQFDGLQARHSAGTARRAMAEIAYLRLDKKRESYALAAEAGSNFGSRAQPFEAGGLLDLQGKALLDMPGVEVNTVAPRVRELQERARRLYGSQSIAARELPRLDVMAGFLEYRLDGFGQALRLFQQAAQTCRQTRDWVCYAVASQDVALLEYEGKNYTVALSTLAECTELDAGGTRPQVGRRHLEQLRLAPGPDGSVQQQ